MIQIHLKSEWTPVTIWYLTEYASKIGKDSPILRISTFSRHTSQLCQTLPSQFLASNVRQVSSHTDFDAYCVMK